MNTASELWIAGKIARDIIFRGMRIDNSQWVYGYLTHTNKKMNPCIHITVVEVYEVYPETVGQYTGLQDMKGKYIYEGDILSGWKKGSNSDMGYTGIIQWRHEQAGWIIKCHKYVMEILSLAQSGWANEPYNIHQLDSFQVIGNIFENLEIYTKS
jgi:uncharacterized phage protein (TIGR01671 family)